MPGFIIENDNVAREPLGPNEKRIAAWIALKFRLILHRRYAPRPDTWPRDENPNCRCFVRPIIPD